MTAPLNTASLVSSWREAMEGVTPGPWQKDDCCQDTVLVETEHGYDEVARVCFVNRHDRRKENDAEERANRDWISRCSPSGISALIDALESTSRALSEKEAELAEARAEARGWQNAAHLSACEAGSGLLEEATRQRDEALAALEMAKRVLREAANHTTGPVYLSITDCLTSLRDATWSIRSALENGPSTLADATQKDPRTEQREAGV